MASDKVLSVKADTAADFLEKGYAKMGEEGKLGETTYDLNAKFTTDGKTGNIATATFTMTTAIVRVQWGGAAKTKPDKANSDAIKKIETLLKAHEQAHADGYNRVFKKLKAEFEKSLIGKSQDELQAAVDQMNEALRAECESLHKSGGMIKLKTGSGGSVSVSEVAAGAGGCD